MGRGWPGQHSGRLLRIKPRPHRGDVARGGWLARARGAGAARGDAARRAGTDDDGGLIQMQVNISLLHPQTSDWLGLLANWANVAIALLALIVAVVSILLSRATSRNQIRHNKLSVKPIPYFRFGDYENRLFVSIKNNGIGPLLVKKVIVSNNYDSKSDLISWMPQHPANVTWAHFSSVLSDRSILPSDEIMLIDLKGHPDDEVFQSYRKLCRSALAPLTLSLDFSDIYSEKIETHSRPLVWFARPIS